MVGKGITSLSNVTLGVRSLTRSLEFYTTVWGLSPVRSDDKEAYLRAAGPQPYVLRLRQNEPAGFLEACFSCESGDALKAVRAVLERANLRGLTAVKPLDTPGGGSGFEFLDPEGRVFRLAAGMESRKTSEPAIDRPLRLAHIVLNAADAAKSSALFTDLLGFRLSDETGMMKFLRCNADHHSIAFAKTGNTSLNHLAFEMPSWDGLMRGAGRLKEAGHRLQWGLGRHGPGANVFAYFLDPDELAIEYTAEVQQIDEAKHRPGTPAEWHRPLNRIDQWGFSDPPSDALKRSMHGEGHS